MLKTSQILVSAITLAGGVLNLSGCGQTGPLYLPVRPGSQQVAPPPPAPATVPDSTSSSSTP